MYKKKTQYFLTIFFLSCCSLLSLGGEQSFEEQFNKDTQSFEQEYAQESQRYWLKFTQTQSDTFWKKSKNKSLKSIETKEGDSASSAQLKKLPQANTHDFYGHNVTTKALESLAFPKSKKSLLNQAAVTGFVEYLTRNQATAKTLEPDISPLTVNSMEKTFLEHYHYWASRITRDSYSKLELLNFLCQKIDYSSLNKNEQVVCNSHFSQHIGLDTKIVMGRHKLHLAVHSKDTWYGTEYTSINNKRYYFVFSIPTNGEKSILNLPERTQVSPVSIQLESGLKPAEKRLFKQHININNHNYSLNLDEDHIRYLHTLPDLAPSNYLHAITPQYLKNQVQEVLTDAFKNTQSAEERWKISLQWLQNLPYKSDVQQFNRNKSLSFSQTLYFKNSDCEDRVYALAAINNIKFQDDFKALHFEIAAIEHLTAKVYNGSKWIDMDPTYIGLALGKRHYAFRKAQPIFSYR